MFAAFGEITFELLGGPGAMETSRRWDYAEQLVLEDVPRLQWIADGLEVITLEMFFHQSFTDPTSQMQALIAAASDHQARPLVFANGDHRGYFVIASLSTTYQQMSDRGDPVALIVRVSLRQWALIGGLVTTPPLPGFSPLAAVVAPPGAPTRLLNTSEPAGVSSNTAPSPAGFTPQELPAPGISLLVTTPSAPGPSSEVVTPDDVLPSTIVRAGS